MDLIEELVSQLGINTGQAEGGAGLLFKLAKEHLGGDFGKISEIVPQVSQWIGQAPEAGKLAGALGGLAGAFGGKAEGLGKLAEIAGGFSSLGLDKSSIDDFASIIMNFLKTQGGEGAAELLRSVLKGSA
jgi:hypothetical protein